MTKDEALKLALEALEYIHEGANNQGPHTGISWRCVSNKAEPAITAIKEALAQPEQKSVAMADYMALTEKYVALKAAQPEQEQFALKHRIAELEGAVIGLQAQRTWVGLTDEEVEDFVSALWPVGAGAGKLLRAIEAKLKEKNT